MYILFTYACVFKCHKTKIIYFILYFNYFTININRTDELCIYIRDLISILILNIFII